MQWGVLTIALLGAGPLRAESHPVCRSLTAQLDTILSAPSLEEANLGVYVERLDDNTPLYGQRPDQTLVPASNVKIVSTAAALHYLGPDHRFHTEVFGDIERGVVNNLTLKGDGDPWLIPERMWYLASRLYYLGVRQVRGDLIVDDSYFAGSRMAKGWEQDRSSYAYMAPMGAVSLGFNTLVVHIYPGHHNGAPATVMIEPKSKYAEIDNRVTTVSSGRSQLNIDVLPKGDRSVVRVEGRINIREPGRGYYRRIDNPPVYAGEVFLELLSQAGINVRVNRVRTGVTPESANRLAQLSSPRLIELINRVNKHSNNFMAEQIALATGAAVYGAPGDWSKAQRAIETFLTQEVGLTPGSFSIGNASGLHDVNRFSPRQLVSILGYMYRRPRLWPEYLASMSVAGGSGTLSSRMRETDASGLLRAKTGTLSIASALTGYVTARRGETLGFSIVVNDYRAAISEIWAAQDEIGAALANLDSRCLEGGSPAPADPISRSTPLPTAGDEALVP